MVSSSPQRPIIFPTGWAKLELKEVRDSVMVTARVVATMEAPVGRSEELIGAASYLFDDLGVEERLVEWDAFLFHHEQAAFADMLHALDKAFNGAPDFWYHDPITPDRFATLQRKAADLLRLMERGGVAKLR